MMKSSRHNFYTTVPLIWEKLSWKKLLLVTSGMLGPFVNTLTTDDKYSGHHRENMLRQIQMQLSQKPKTFCQLLIAFLNSTSNFEYFETKISPIA